MAADAFYALNEVFAFAASSEMQLLNLIDAKLTIYTENDRHGPTSLPNLTYAKHILYEHIKKIQEVVDSIRSAKHPKWPKAEATEDAVKAQLAAEGVEKDYIHLLNRAEMLHRRCNDSITILMSSMAIEESRQAIEQAKQVSRLTFLAFIFVPLSFTTSFFGMNVQELRSPKLWWWVTLSVPIVAIALALFFLDFARPFRVAYRKVRKG